MVGACIDEVRCTGVPAAGVHYLLVGSHNKQLSLLRTIHLLPHPKKYSSR